MPRSEAMARASKKYEQEKITDIINSLFEE